MGTPAKRSAGELADLATPMAVRVAATLSLVERAGSAGTTAEQLAEETGANAPALRLLLDHLVTVGVFDVDGERYRPTELGAQLHEDAPGGIKPLLDINCSGGRAELAFVELLGTITTGAPAYPRRYGTDFWSDLDARPELRRSFDAHMNWRFREHAPRIARGFDRGRFAEILDVGGGDGTLLAEILRAHPGVRGRVLDVAATTAAAAARFSADGLGDRAGVVAGSFFEPLPTGADACLLCDVLHDWDDRCAREMLAGCRRAVADNGAVVVIEPIRGAGVGTARDLHMLMCFGGREREVDEIAALASSSGLELRGRVPVSEGRTALEFASAPSQF
ncbi:methyltransferase [Saccharopolyspora griseoalba]|uniref:Methyltransferase n=1 Tax=Saccharopolyspora griseoalba TaxID=1431848 RepID=A0ABW2LSX8_9PSEU